MRGSFDYPLQIHVVDENHDIIETLAEMRNFNAALAAFDAYLAECSMSIIQLRQKSRIVWTGRTGLYDSSTGKVELIERF